MAGKREELKTESLEEEIEEIKGDLRRLFERILPPREVRDEVLKNLYTIELSFMKIIKTLVDYKVQTLEELTREKPKKKSKKIEIE